MTIIVVVGILVVLYKLIRCVYERETFKSWPGMFQKKKDIGIGQLNNEISLEERQARREQERLDEIEERRINRERRREERRVQQQQLKDMAATASAEAVAEMLKHNVSGLVDVNLLGASARSSPSYPIHPEL